MDFRDRYNILMDETTASYNVSEVQKPANSFELAEEQTCQLGERSDYRTTFICNKPAKPYKRTRNPAHKDQWQLLDQG